MKRALALLGLALLCACARFPNDKSGVSGIRLTCSMTVAGVINPNYVYIFAFRPVNDSNPTDQGPIPVVAPPWGNGFVAGNCSYFVRWDPLASPRYSIYKFDDSLLNHWFTTGSPVNAVDVATGGSKLQFDIDLTQLAATSADADKFKTLQFNVLTMDKVPQGTTGSKLWDALGDGNTPSGINNWVNISLQNVGVYNNLRFGNLEPKGDVADPDLDISDWSVEVRHL